MRCKRRQPELNNGMKQNLLKNISLKVAFAKWHRLKKVPSDFLKTSEEFNRLLLGNV